MVNVLLLLADSHMGQTGPDARVLMASDDAFSLNRATEMIAGVDQALAAMEGNPNLVIWEEGSYLPAVPSRYREHPLFEEAYRFLVDSKPKAVPATSMFLALHGAGVKAPSGHWLANHICRRHVEIVNESPSAEAWMAYLRHVRNFAWAVEAARSGKQLEALGFLAESFRQERASIALRAEGLAEQVSYRMESSSALHVVRRTRRHHESLVAVWSRYGIAFHDAAQMPGSQRDSLERFAADTELNALRVVVHDLLFTAGAPERGLDAIVGLEVEVLKGFAAEVFGEMQPLSDLPRATREWMSRHEPSLAF